MKFVFFCEMSEVKLKFSDVKIPKIYVAYLLVGIDLISMMIILIYINVLNLMQSDFAN